MNQNAPLTTRTVLHLVGRRFKPATRHNPATRHVVLTIAGQNDNPLLSIYADPDQVRYLLKVWQAEMARLDADLTDEEKDQ